MAITTGFFSPARLSRTPLALALGLHVLGIAPLQAQPLAPAVAPAVAPASPMASASSAAAPRATRQPVGCLIAPERVADIGTPVIGVVSSVEVDSGDTVRAGQPLVQLQADVEQAGVQAAQARSAIDAEVRAAHASLVLARQRHTRASDLLKAGFVSAQAVEQASAERDVAEQKLEQARGQQRVISKELGVVRAQLGQRTVRSPFQGVVVERFVSAGERVENKPLLRLVMLDPLRVELVLPASRWGSVALRDRIEVTPELPGAEPVATRVTHVDPLIDAASNTFRVRLALPNPGHKLPAGARCRVEVPAVAAPAPAVNPALSRQAAVIPKQNG